MNLKNNIKNIKGFILLSKGKVYDSYSGLYKVIDILIKDNLIFKIEKNIQKKNKL